jgi:hypothetical protein
MVPRIACVDPGQPPHSASEVVVRRRPVHQPPARAHAIPRRIAPAPVELRQVRILDAQKVKLRRLRRRHGLVVVPFRQPSSALGKAGEDNQQRSQHRARGTLTASHTSGRFL